MRNAHTKEGNMRNDVKEALAKAQSALAHLVRTLAETSDSFAYGEAEVAERTLDWVALRLIVNDQGTIHHRITKEQSSIH
jgi:hypothetical protein